VDLGMMSLSRQMITAALMRLFPLELKRSKGWQLTKTEKQCLIQDLLKETHPCSPFAGKRVLFWEPGGMRLMLRREGVIATALRLRGAEVRVVICDGAPSACILREVSSEQPLSLWSKKCSGCHQDCADEAASFDLPYNSIGELVLEKRRAELYALAQKTPIEGLTAIQLHGVEVGKLAMSSIIRYFKGQSSRGHEHILREYLYASLVNTEAAIIAIERFRPDRVFMSHGWGAVYGTAVSVAANGEIPVVDSGSGYREGCLYIHTIEHRGNRSRQMLSEKGWQHRKEQPLTKQEDEHLDRYLNARYTGKIVSDLRVQSLPETPDRLRRKLALLDDKPVWCVFTHLSWDNVFDFAPMLFDTSESWVLETVRTIITVPSVMWLIKIHPGEVKRGTVYGVKSLIEEHFPELPANIKIIPADSEINTYGLYPILDGGVSVFGTAGLEMAVLGKPVILAGEAHYGNKGFTYNPLTKEDYSELLRRAADLPKLSADQEALARQYAYSYFIQRQIPFRMIKKGYDGWGPLDYKKLDLLLPGNDPFLDMICERIFDGKDFVMDERLVALSETLI
jgi:hypothetical protein